MLLENARLEQLAVRTMASRSNRAGSILFSSLRADHFNSSMREVFERMVQLTRESGQTTSWKELSDDPGLSETVRYEMSEVDAKPLNSPSLAKKLANRLNSYRQLRALFEIADAIGNKLRQDKVDVSKLLESTTNMLTDARVSHGTEGLYHHGDLKDKRALKMLKDILKGRKLKFIPTGFDGFDSINKGIFTGSCVLIGATSGGGKTATSLQMAINMARWGARVCYVSLEMSSEEMETRLASNLSKISLNKLISPRDRLDLEEKRTIMRKAREFHEQLAHRNALLTIHAPEEDIGIEELMFSVKPYGFDVVFVDYINLLRDMDGDMQWQRLSAGARFVKRFAAKNKCIVVLLVQLSEEGVIRYSKGLKEHATNFWSWVYDNDAKESHILSVKQQKARNQKAHDFFLYENFDTMTVIDHNGADIPRSSSNKSPKKGGRDDDDYLRM